MSEPINANPQVLDEALLPSRQPSKEKSFVQLQLGFLDVDAVDTVYASEAGSGSESESESDDYEEPIDAQEIYDLISTISDPEHPLTLGQLAVVNLEHITVVDTQNRAEMGHVNVEITPTITHCSLATLIGLGIRVRLERSLPPRFRITINVRPGTHQSEGQVNKQLNDKERVAAACENEQLLAVVGQMLATCK